MRVGMQELIVILLIAAIIFGGAKISGLGKAVGKSIREFKEEINDSNESDKSNKSKDNKDSEDNKDS